MPSEEAALCHHSHHPVECHLDTQPPVNGFKGNYEQVHSDAKSEKLFLKMIIILG